MSHRAPARINGKRSRDDYVVIWRSDFGERRVGRILLTQSSSVAAWGFHLHADIAVPPWCNGRADSLKAARVEFRRVFEKFCDDAGDLSKVFTRLP